MTQQRFVTALVVLLLLGWSLQLEGGARMNTIVKIIDLTMNFVVILWSAIEIVGGGRSSLVWAFLLYRSCLNILPFLKIMFINYTSNPSLETVQRVLLESRSLYNIYWEKRMGEPCIYVANHALWSLDDFVALSAIPRRNLSIVMNAGPAGLTSIPKHCKEYVCVIHREEGVKGSGFKAMDEIIHSEVIDRKKSLLVFPEDMKRKKDVNNLAPLRSGVIKLAMRYNIPIIPLWIDWPCQFPTVLNTCEKTVIIREGDKLLPEGFDSIDSLKNTVYKKLLKISK